MTREQKLEAALARLLDSGSHIVDLDAPGRTRATLRPTIAAVRNALALLGLEPKKESDE